ncbi:hypothetical protein L6273_06365 [Candidatus Parcubacteria bacterium]|nr:hypothetical protein [Candidatus Parcubacteria bacterium]
MKIDLHKIKIAEVVKAYKDSAEEGVSAFTTSAIFILCKSIFILFF